MTATDTRRLTNIMRDLVRNYRGSFTRAGFTPAVVLDRRYNRRRYAIDYSSSMRAGWLAYIDTTERTAWIRPSANALTAGDKVALIWHDAAHCTLLLDALFTELARQGYTLSQWSETPDSLATSREVCNV